MTTSRGGRPRSGATPAGVAAALHRALTGCSVKEAAALHGVSDGAVSHAMPKIREMLRVWPEDECTC